MYPDVVNLHLLCPMLCEFTQGSSDLLNSYKISAIASFPSFPEMVYLSEGVFINYSDASEEMVIQPGLLGYLEREFDVCVSIISGSIPRMQDDPCYRWAHLIRNILNNSSASHSVSIINGFEQAAGKTFQADVLHVQETERSHRRRA